MIKETVKMLNPQSTKQARDHKISLLTLGLGARLFLVLPLIALLWLAVWGVIT